MISISRLLCDTVSHGDHLRYRETSINSSATNKMAAESPRPVVVWNCTRQCNLSCIHCYANAGAQKLPGEMDTKTGKKFVGDLADFGVPVLLFSGGEPFLRHDLFELAGYAREQGIRVALSTNGTLITEETAHRIKNIGFSEVGISLDGIGPIVVMGSVSVLRSVATAVMVVVPALYVEENVAVAYTLPVGTVSVGWTVPTFSSEEDNCTVMVVGDFVILPNAFRSSTTICGFSVLSASVLGGAAYT